MFTSIYFQDLDTFYLSMGENDDTCTAGSDVTPNNIRVIIIYGREDRQTAEIYHQHLHRDILSENDSIDISLYDNQHFKSLEEAFELCNFAFVLITKRFCEKDWFTISTEECFMNSLYGLNRKCPIIPVMMERELDSDFRVPMALNALKTLMYFNNDTCYKEAIRRLLRLKS